jgi:small-conductance mechanosensitive channel
MGIQKVQIIETLIVILLYIIIFYLTKNTINRYLKNKHLQRTRRKILIKVVHFFSSIAAVIFIAAIWGLKQNEIAVFASSILTAIGIAFFAQWSLLSNITSSILLFFNHPLKFGDYITVLDKDFPFEGEVRDLTFFFVHLKTKEGEIITIPNNLIFQKSISIIPSEDK